MAAFFKRLLRNRKSEKDSEQPPSSAGSSSRLPLAESRLLELIQIELIENEDTEGDDERQGEVRGKPPENAQNFGGKRTQNKFMYMKFEVVFEDRDFKIRVLRLALTEQGVELANCSRHQDETIQPKTIMLLGKTGEGKTTSAEGLVNYYYGTMMESNYRLRIECGKENSVESVTEYITMYIFPCLDGVSIAPYPLHILDKPGLCDTKGIQCDLELLYQRYTYLFSKSSDGIREYVSGLHAVCFVMNSTHTRKGAELQYATTQILSTLGKNLEKNFIIFFTHCTDNKPKSKGVLDALNVKSDHLFNFNFEGVGAFIQNDDEDRYIGTWKKFFVKPCGEFFHLLGELLTQETETTSKVVSLKAQIYYFCETFIGFFMETTAKMVRTEKVRKQVDAWYELKDSSRHHTITIERDEHIDPTLTGKTAITCSKCEKSCLDFEKIRKAEDLTFAIDTKTALCKSCGCVWNCHVTTQFMPTTTQKTVEVTTVIKLMEQYKLSSKQEQNKKTLQKRLEHEIMAYSKEAYQILLKIKSAWQTMNEICLLPNPSNDDAYLDQLIAIEVARNGPDSKEQIEVLNNMKEYGRVLSLSRNPNLNPKKFMEQYRKL